MFQVPLTPVSEENVLRITINGLMWPFCSCDLDDLYLLSFPLPKESPHEMLL